MVVRPSVRLSVCPYVHMSGCPFVRISMYDRVSVRDPHPDVEVSSEIGALAPIERLVSIYVRVLGSGDLGFEVFGIAPSDFEVLRPRIVENSFG